MRNPSPKVHLLLYLENLSSYSFHLVYPKAQISLSVLFMTSLDSTRSPHKVKVADILDDSLIYSRTEKEQLEMLGQCFQTITHSMTQN